MGEPLIITVRVNEIAAREDDRPNLPLTPAEIVADAVATSEAGASVFHWHARDPESGAPCNEIDLFRDVYRGVRESTDLLLYPTLGYIVDQDPESRTAHIAAVADDPVLRVDVAPVDFGSLNLDRWDPERQRFDSEDVVYLNPTENLRRVLERLRDLGVTVSTVCWNVGHVRTAGCFRELGLLGPTVWEYVFTGATIPSGTPPTRLALEAMREQTPAGEPWSVLCAGGDALELAQWAIEQGGHVSIGLGDWHYKDLGSPTNAEIVARVAALAARAGREVATPEQARAVLGLG